ncbi:hypothetical protein [Sphingorhabdus sp. M41]|uniref:hypothetical protein n=1 Tax=Sphingorhabdus sp. M41 TaxID=1806885 RepID=UPI00078BE6D7|nr:hypothetical protein [Sphingorhabdus sp. M41]AMO72860.1 hypothetical protein AZE99_14265 [Sphingorhabdus sp. M41]
MIKLKCKDSEITKMKFGKIAACIAATSLIAAPALAQSQQSVAKPVASKVERVSAKTEKASNLEGSGALLGILASVAVIGGFFLIAEVSDNDNPTSP